MGLPNIIINFSTLASSAVTRSERGIMCMVVNDSTKSTQLTEYLYAKDVKAEDWTTDNFNAIRDAFHDGAKKLYVVRTTSLEDVEDVLDSLAFNWMCYINSSSQQDVADYVETRNTANPNRQIKAVVYNIAAADKHVVNFVNTSLVRKGSSSTLDGYKFLGRLMGIFAAMPFTKSATYYLFDDVESVTEVANVETAIDAGKLCIINDYGEPKIARAVNSLVTPGTGENASMKKITIVEAMDMIKEDIATTFKNDFVGKFKNNLDNQQVFLSAVNVYFDKLATEGVLDKNFDNSAAIDVPAQRTALIEAGHPEAAEWDDLTVMENTVGSDVFLAGTVKILDAIEDLTFNITMA